MVAVRWPPPLCSSCSHSSQRAFVWLLQMARKSFWQREIACRILFLWSHRSITHPPIGSTGPVHAMGITGACRRFQHCPGQYFVGKNESSYVVPLSKPETQETKCGDSGHSAPIFSDRNFAPWAYHFDQTKTWKSNCGRCYPACWADLADWAGLAGLAGSAGGSNSMPCLSKAQC